MANIEIEGLFSTQSVTLSELDNGTDATQSVKMVQTSYSLYHATRILTFTAKYNHFLRKRGKSNKRRANLINSLFYDGENIPGFSRWESTSGDELIPRSVTSIDAWLQNNMNRSIGQEDWSASPEKGVLSKRDKNLSILSHLLYSFRTTQYS